MIKRMLVGLTAAAAINIASASSPESPPVYGGCAEGAYQSPQGAIAVLTKPPEGSPPGARYALLSGHRGYTSEADSPLACDGGLLKSRSQGKLGETWTRMTFKETPARFDSAGVQLAGLLLEPIANAAKAPLVVLVHGSEKNSPIHNFNQYLLAAQGVSVFAYDKRGTAGSGGVYTQDFRLLAEDAANAAKAARGIAKGHTGRLGFYGGSQGGWIAPMAALAAHADFVEVGFGVVGTALEQDQWQVDYQLKQLGFADSILPAVHEVTAATAKVAASDFNEGLDEIARLRNAYSGQPWFAKIDGQYSGLVLRGEIARAKEESPQVPWDYATQASLAQLSIPQLWVLAKDDATAPSAPSIERLRSLKKAGANITITVFPDTDHGIRTFTTDKAGTRVYSGFADGYYRLLADWAKGIQRPPYGTAMMDDATPATAAKAKAK
jgi:pimeloyl-ACP methyl ester carboxylesterase